MLMQRNLQRRYAPLPLVICLIHIGLLFTACDGVTATKTHTIGVVNYYSALESVLESFKAKMAALGDVDGKNVYYLSDGALENDPVVLGGEVKHFVDQK